MTTIGEDAAAATAELARLRARIVELEAGAGRYGTLVQATAAIVWTADASGAVVDDLPSWRAYTGQSAAAIQGQGWQAAVHPDDRAATAAAWTAAMAAGSSYRVEYRLRRHDGVYESFIARGVPVHDAGGRVHEWVGTCTNVEARRQAEAARATVEAELRRQLTFTAAITASLGEGVYAVDAAGQVTFVNPAAERMLGWAAADLLGRPLHETIHFQREDGSPVPREACTMLGVLRSGQTVAVAHDTFTRRDGTVFPVAYTAAPIFTGGAIAGVVEVFHDISERRRADEERALLLASEQAARAEAEAAGRRLAFLAGASAFLSSSLDSRRTLEHLAALVVPHLADWCVVDLLTPAGALERVAVAHSDPAKVAWAREFERRYPLNAGPTGGVGRVTQTGQSALYPEIPDALLAAAIADPELLAIVRALGMRSMLIVPLKAPQRIAGAITLVAAESGRRYGAEDLALAEDLGRRAGLAVEHARLYADLQETVRIREEFLSIASHELKTPLTSLQLQVQLLRRVFEKGTLGDLRPERVTAMLQTAERQTKQLVRLIDALLDVSRLTAGGLDLHLQDIDLAAIARDVAARSAPQLTYSGSALSVDAPAPVVGRWDPARVEQVITNLLSNAIKYGRGRPITVRVAGAGDRARLTVRDEGLGIAPADARRIFDRFERAVPAHNYGGLGLGLYIVRQIVEALGGTVDVTSAPDAGATFEVLLPLTGPPAGAAAPHPAAKGTP